jgi:hypothetical protein
MADDLEQSVSIEAAARLLGVHFNTVRNHILLGQLRATRQFKPGSYRVPLSALAEFKPSKRGPKPKREATTVAA